jgi:hypothetical protein
MVNTDITSSSQGPVIVNTNVTSSQAGELCAEDMSVRTLS